MSEPKRHDADEALAVLALLAQTGAVRGPRPTPLELLELSHGTLPVGRQVEIESHVAHDPSVFAAFMSGSQSVRERAAPRQTRVALPRLQKSLAVLAACVVAIIGTLLVVNAPNQVATPDPARRGDVTFARSAPAPAPASDWRRRAVRFGYEHPSELARAFEPSADAFSSVCNGAGCDSEIDALTDLGTALARLDVACREQMSSASKLAAAPNEADRLQHLRAAIRDGHWLHQIDQLSAALARPAAEACTRIEHIRRRAGAAR